MAASSSNSNEKADRWYFTKDQLENTPSRKCGYEALKELKYRQQAANFIQEMGQKLKVTQLCINTAIVYMHRFYVFHSFSNFPWHQMASAALFLAAKVEEQPRKLEYVIRVANLCRNPKDTSFDVTSERYLVQSQDLVFNENVLLQTLGFDVAIDHPHTHVVRCCHLVRASKDLAQTSYFMASNSLHLTTMCLQYKPTVVACFCIHVACKWSNWEIPLSNEKKEWFSYVDSTVTAEQLQQLTEEFLVIFGNCSSRLKEKIMAIGDIPHSTEKHLNSPFDTDPKKIIREEPKEHPHRPHESKTAEDPHKHRRPHDQSSSSQQQREREYREKKERERLAQAHHGSKPQQSTDPQKAAHAHHHRPPPADAKLKPVRPQPPSNNHPPNPAAAGNLRAAVEPRDILREAARDSPFGIAQPQQNVNKDLVRSDKDKYLVKSNVLPSTDSNSNSVKYPPSAYEKHRVDPNRTQQRPPHDPSKVPSKPFKQENNKQFAGDYASNNKNVPPPGHFNKPPSTSHPKIKTEPVAESHKSVPNKHYNKPQPQNGSNQPYHPSSATKPIKQEIKVEIPIPAAGIKRPSLFSPEKSPPHMQQQKHKLQTVPPLLTPVESPASHRSRNYSSSSEPELRPVLKKIDTVAGYENILRDNGIKKFENEGIKLEPMTTSLVNGIETNPTLISNLLKETPSISHLSTVSAQLPVKQEAIEEPKEHSHHKSKKKNKEKHKHKDKDRNRDDKEKKKKHKDKDREKHKKDKSTGDPEPIKIKIALPPAQDPPQGLRITIPKDRIQTDSISQPPVKIKISKDVINNCASAAESKKRERSSDSGSSAAPPAKAPRYKEGKPNGRHSYNKVRETHFNRRPHMPPQNNYYPPYPMGQPPMHMPHPMHMQYHPPPNFMYPPQQFYMYPPDMYSQPPPPTGGSNPPLPMDAPPDVPPPPPPE